MSDSPTDSAANAESAKPAQTEADARVPAPIDRKASAPGGKPGSQRAILIAFVAAALAILGWQWYDGRMQVGALQEELARRLADAEIRNKEARATAQAAGATVRELSAKVEEFEGRLADSQNQQVALEALYQKLSRNSDEWALAEIEQTLTIAAQHLQLAGNVKAAILALQNAEMRLQRIDRPQLASLRAVIECDLERLRVAPHVAVTALTIKIDRLVGAIDTLPLAMPQRPTPQPSAAREPDDAGAIVRLAREIWQDLRGLVRIQAVDKPEVPLIEPTHEFFLRENLKLRLLSARIALLQRDEKTYRTDLQIARQWVERFYDTRDRKLASTLRVIGQLAEVQIGVDVPDISASLNAVRDYKLTRETMTIQD